MNRFMRLLIVLLFASLSSVGQKLKKADKAMITNLQAHIMYLADDKLEGRRAGTNGEKLAREYISNQFQKTGLEPRGEQGWLQPFEIYDGKQIGTSTLLYINDHELKLTDEFFPFVFSPNTSIESAVSPAVKEKGVPWFDDLKDVIEENKENPHFDLTKAIKTIASKAAEKGATALFVYNTSDIPDNLKFDSKDNSQPIVIPVIYLTAKARQQYLSEESATLDIRLKTAIGDKKRTGNNVIGFINNGAASTIIFGAHYDHLGYGEDGNSLHATGERQIHNGADDNASGTAALIELARLLKQSKNKNNNYAFIAFSGEELGLFGSKYFTEHPTVSLQTVNYMINMDMIGRLNDTTKSLTIGGYGTSPVWGNVFTTLNKQKYFSLRYDSSGTGPSDHTSFYLKNIPVLFFFTGLHTDYHKPTDDFNKINYTGEALVIKYIESLVNITNDKGKLAFQKTREAASGTTARFNVTLGIMPDYTFSGVGVRVDQVSEGRPAQKAGIQTGDIIVQLGTYDTSSLETYMQALSKFNKGEKTTVKYKRGEETKVGDVQF
jgi:aminopeptidase YwaD